MVSGAAALLFEGEPRLTRDEVKARLMRTARKELSCDEHGSRFATGQTYTSRYDIFTVGAGYLDVGAALASIEGSLQALLRSPPAQSITRVPSPFR